MRYKIEGGEMPVVTCTLENNESMITESGSMAWMSPNMEMKTSGGGLGKVFGRIFSGERMFQNIYTARNGSGVITFASSFPGEIRAFEITPGRSLVVQKSGFLAAQQGIDVSVFFQKRLGAGLFGGEGFIMQKLSGSGTAFIEVDGSAVEYELAAGQSIVVSTGYLAAIDETCTMDIVTVPGVKNMVFGGEGVFNTVVHGPGRILLQTMPISRVAGAISPYITVQSNNG